MFFQHLSRSTYLTINWHSVVLFNSINSERHISGNNICAVNIQIKVHMSQISRLELLNTQQLTHQTLCTSLNEWINDNLWQTKHICLRQKANNVLTRLQITQRVPSLWTPLGSPDTEILINIFIELGWIGFYIWDIFKQFYHK